ncbi:MAG: hypothetical protein IT303_00330 [Dehalococcoidia bacterium]|nr:hypothetical protein [Dehalococcoidia bacterium]
MAFEPTPLCILWGDNLTTGSGFRVVLSYPESGETFAYDVPASATALVVPVQDAPPTEDCGGARHVFTVELRALPDLRILDGTAVTYDCPYAPRRQEPPIPSAR